MRKQFSLYLLGNVLFGLSQWITVIILAKATSLTEIGLYSLGLAYSGPLLLLLGWGLKTIYITDEEPNNALFIVNRFVMLIVFINAIIFILLIKKFDGISLIFVLLVSLIKGVEFLQEILFAIRQKRMEHHIIGLFKIIQSIVTVAIVSLLFIDRMSSILIFSLVLAFTIILCSIEFIRLEMARKVLYRNIKLKSVFNLTVIGFSMGLTLAISSLNTNFPRLILESSYNLEVLGYFSALMFFYSAGNTFMFSVSGYLLPLVIKNNNNKKFIINVYKKISIVFLVVALLGLNIVYFVGDHILRILYNESFAVYEKEFFIIMVAAVLTYYIILIDVIFQAYKKFKLLLSGQIITSIVVFIGSYFLIPTWGIIGACYVFLIGMLVQLILKLSIMFSPKKLL